MREPATRQRAIPSNGRLEAGPPESALEVCHRPRHLAARWGLTRQSIYNLIKSGELDVVRIAGQMRVPESSALAYLARCGLTVKS
jgi:Helix-turn-helix domain